MRGLYATCTAYAASDHKAKVHLIQNTIIMRYGKIFSFLCMTSLLLTGCKKNETAQTHIYDTDRLSGEWNVMEDVQLYNPNDSVHFHYYKDTCTATTHRDETDTATLIVEFQTEFHPWTWGDMELQVYYESKQLGSGSLTGNSPRGGFSNDNNEMYLTVVNRRHVPPDGFYIVNQAFKRK
jgi:hypothetical protein